MEILSVTLKNFKSHSDRHFVFQPGTNAICGENGAGKTSILEAIAWTLFNYRGDYRNEDLIRNGAGSAQAIVAFVSNRDGRTYEVQRCTTKGYTLFDPQLGERLDYKHIDEEVMPWLRQHFGVTPGTNLGKLFANTIGVPQGTFTVDFLQTVENRKKVFDAILKVEDYKQAYTHLSSLEKYAKTEVEILERSIAQYTEELQKLAPLQQQQQQVVQEISDNETALQQLHLQLEQLQSEKERLATQAKWVEQLAQQVNTLTLQINSQRQANQRLQQLVERAEQAVEACQTHRSSYDAFLAADALLQDLDRQAKQRQTLITQRETQQQTLAAGHVELARLQVQLESLTQAQQTIDQLHPLVQQQEDLEMAQAILVEQLQQLQTQKVKFENTTNQLAKTQRDLAALIAEISRIQTLQNGVKPLAAWEHQRDRLQEQLSRIEAAKQFEADLQQLILAGDQQRDRHHTQAHAALATLRQIQQSVPLLATTAVDAALQAIEAGMELNQALLQSIQGILADLSEQVSPSQLRQQLQTLNEQIKRAYQVHAEVATLETKVVQRLQWEQEVEQGRDHLAALQRTLAHEAEYQTQRSRVAAELTAFGDPRSRRQLLQHQLGQYSNLDHAHQVIQQTQTTLQAQLGELNQQLAAFDLLDATIDEQKHRRQIHQLGHVAYLQAQPEAERLPALSAELAQARGQLQALTAALAEHQTVYDSQRQTYDPHAWQQTEAAYNTARSQADRIAGSLPQQRKLLDELDQRLLALEETIEKRDRAQIALKQKQQTTKFVRFARDAYKKAGPRITERYVQRISREADRLFRELLNRPNVALEWTRDYEILVQEGAHTRRFINLSGGEQMCAALAVRLALLRVLADIDIAFFDEPTTNMDRPRRESLAEAIANIRTFRQLFVISHDDTFEKVTENVILVEREV